MGKIINCFAALTVSFIFTFIFVAGVYTQEATQLDVSHQNPNKEKISGETDVRKVKRQTSNNSRNLGGFVISAYLGVARTAPTDLTISQPALNTQLTFNNVRLGSRSFESPQYYGIRTGYFFNRAPFIGAEAELIHLKVYSDPEQRVQAAGVHRGRPINGEIKSAM